MSYHGTFDTENNMKPMDGNHGLSTFEADDDKQSTVLTFVKRGAIVVAMVATSVFVISLLPHTQSQESVTTVQMIETTHDPHESNSPTGTKMEASHKPNFIFLLADDLGYQSVSPEDHDLAGYAPFLQRMADDGIGFSNYYTMEVCTPARASLMTGRYPLSMGMQFEVIQPDYTWGLPFDETILPEMLKTGGDYKNYAVGKWNLGHFTPELLPTARGFDQFLGYLGGQSFYWTKRMPDYENYTDMTISDTECFSPYKENDLNKYSTFLYRDKAVSIIEHHDFDANPMFMYLAFQAVHDPFDDTDYMDGIPSDYVSTDIQGMLESSEMGTVRKQYAMALHLMDEAVATIYQAVKDAGQIHNTYFIFASDNGGCYEAGGRNGGLRGVKGSLWEGGTKVDAYMYHPDLQDGNRGKVYGGLMHISDWVPTILGLAGVEYSADESHPFDGIDQSPAILDTTGTVEFPRTSMLYNMYYNIDKHPEFAIDTNAPVAVRHGKFKLIHAYMNPSGFWYDPYTVLSGDDNLESFSCTQDEAMQGTNFQPYLFDLEADPFETTNLYELTTAEVVAAKEKLYEMIEDFKLMSRNDFVPQNGTEAAQETWNLHDMYIGPWAEPFNKSGSYPVRCNEVKNTFLISQP